MDTYLKVFEANLVSIDPKIKPEDQDNLDQSYFRFEK